MDYRPCVCWLAHLWQYVALTRPHGITFDTEIHELLRPGNSAGGASRCDEDWGMSSIFVAASRLHVFSIALRLVFLERYTRQRLPRTRRSIRTMHAILLLSPVPGDSVIWSFEGETKSYLPGVSSKAAKLEQEVSETSSTERSRSAC